MARTGPKSGADAISKEFLHQCRTLAKYSAVLSVLVGAAQGAGAITSGEATLINAWISAATGTCHAFKKLADYNSLF